MSRRRASKTKQVGFKKAARALRKELTKMRKNMERRS